MDNSVMDNASELNQTQAEPIVQQTAEKMLPQSQVNDIVSNAKREAAARAVEAYKRQQAEQSPSLSSQYQEQGTRVSSEDDIKRVANDEIKRHFGELQREAEERAQMEAANRIVGQFKDKIVAGKDKFSDFESVTGNVAMQYYPNVVQLLAEQVDNTADVLYHLAKNRDKLYRLESLSAHNPADAIYEIKRLADSIKSNDLGSNVKEANAPLSQQRPSNTGTESGSLSWSDLKRKYRG